MGKNRGMTLVEILVSVLLFALVAIPLGNFLVKSFKFQSRSQQMTQTNEIATFVAEHLKNGDDTTYFSESAKTFSFNDFCESIGSTNSYDRDYNIKLESEKISEADLGEDTYTEMPSVYNGILTITSSGIRYEGDIEISIEGNTVTINNIYGSNNNNLKIEKEGSIFPEIYIKNLSSTQLKIYKQNDINVIIVGGKISQINLSSNDNNVFDLYKVTITVSDEIDSSIKSVLETTVKVKDNLK